MSRGPGKWQRIILDGLAAHDWRYLHDLIPSKRKVRHTWVHSYAEKPKWGPRPYMGLTKSDRLAALWAAHTLATQGKIGLYTSPFRMLPTVVTRPGVPFNHWDVAIKPRDFNQRDFPYVSDNCSGLRTGGDGPANRSTSQPTIIANKQGSWLTIIANGPTLLCE
jgi:hypothetical protein